MKRNGFIATSVLYSFFLIFITLFVALIMNYLHNQVLISKIDEESWNFLMTINNTKLTDLKVGDRIKFATQGDNPIINEDASWIVALITPNPIDTSKKDYYFLSDLDAQNVDVKVQLAKDTFEKVHPMTIDVYKELINQNKYTSTLKFKKMNQIQIPTATILKQIRKQNVDASIKDAIFGVTGGYVVLADDTDNSNYTYGSYYENRVYSFSLKDAQNHLVTDYCGATFENGKLTYVPANTFGYTNIVKETIKNTEYVDYCTYANPIKYVHNKSDLVVDQDEAADSDKLLTTYSSLYTIRLMGKATVAPNDEDIYIAGGKGTMMDPYIMTNGVKQS